jgi:Fe2+ or Zn2+ uptake regulation protein
MQRDVVSFLRDRGIQPSPQRVAVAGYVLFTDRHPTAEEVCSTVQRGFPLLSRATVYNTLNLFVRKGLLRACTLAEGRVVFDPNVTRHHHFVDERTGRIYDVPWEALEVRRVETLKDYRVRDYQVVLRGRKAGRRHHP